MTYSLNRRHNHSLFVNFTDRQLCSNHRTIPLISHPSKIMLKIIIKRLENILETEVKKTQAGFRKGKTEETIFSTSETLSRNLER